MYWKSALSIPYSPLMDCYFYTSANGEWQVAVYTLLFFFIVSINGLLLLHIYKRRMGCEPYMPYGFPSLSPLTDCYLYTSANEEWACNRVCLMVSFPCLHWWIATSTHLQMKNEHVTVYALWFSFIVSINGLSLLHFCKWRMGSESYMPYGFPSLSPLTDCYFYTSTNGEWAVNRICFMAFLHCLLWRIVTSTLLQMENGHVTVYALWFSFIVSINGLSLLHFCKWRMGSESYMPYGFPSLSPLTDCYFYTSTNGEWAVNRICFMAFLHCLLWRIVTSTLLQMENGHVTVYALWFSFIVSINGLSLLHFCKWRTCM